jgi:hypothetical protein
VERAEDGSRRAPISLPRELVELLSAHVKAMLEHRMKLGLGAWKDTDFLFTGTG